MPHAPSTRPRGDGTDDDASHGQPILFQVLHPLTCTPARPGLTVMIVGPVMLLLALMEFRPPVRSLSVAQ